MINCEAMYPEKSKLDLLSARIENNVTLLEQKVQERFTLLEKGMERRLVIIESQTRSRACYRSREIFERPLNSTDKFCKFGLQILFAAKVGPILSAEISGSESCVRTDSLSETAGRGNAENFRRQ